MSIFRGYDIRGEYPEKINEEIVYRIARAFVTYLKCDKVAIGYDMRTSSKPFAEAFANGVVDQGADVYNLGLCTTPLANYYAAKNKFPALAIITASHSPNTYNGIKLIREKANQLNEEKGLKEVEELFEKNEFKKVPNGKMLEVDPLPEYLKDLEPFYDKIKGLKLVCDFGNGVGALTAKPFFRKADVDVRYLYETCDDSFPHHDPNPHDIENFKELQEEVVKMNADAGIFFDGDADRCTFVDEKGEVVMADLLFGVIVKEELKNNLGKKVYYDLRFSKAIPEIIKQNKGVPVMMRVGNPFYKEKLAYEPNGLLAGEFSGHIMFKKHFGIDDGLYAAITVLEIMTKYKKKLSELIKPINKYFGSEELNHRVKNPEKVVEAFALQYGDGKVNRLDGVKVEYDDWWFSIRKSNTEPLIRLRLEADTPELLKEKKAELTKVILKYKS